jgi:hypothetical protein
LAVPHNGPQELNGRVPSDRHAVGAIVGDSQLRGIETWVGVVLDDWECGQAAGCKAKDGND